MSAVLLRPSGIVIPEYASHALQLTLPIFLICNVYALQTSTTSMPTINVWLAIYLEDGTQPLKLASLAHRDSPLTKLDSHASALQLHPTSPLISNVLHAMLPTIGTKHPKHAFLAE